MGRAKREGIEADRQEQTCEGRGQRRGGERERKGELCVDGRGDGSVGKLSSVFQARVELRSPGPVLVPCGAHSDPLTWEGEGETAAWKLRSAKLTGQCGTVSGTKVEGRARRVAQ